MSTTTFSHRSASGRPLLLRVDFALVLSTILVAAFGVVIVYSATRSKLVLDGVNPHYYLDRQAAYVVVGVIVMMVLAALDYRWLEHASAVLYVGIVLALLAMFTPHRVERARAPRGGSRWPVSRSSRRPSPPSCSSSPWPPSAPDVRRASSGSDLLKVLALAACRSCWWSSSPTWAAASSCAWCCSSCWWWPASPTATSCCSSCSPCSGRSPSSIGLLKSYQFDRLTSFLHQRQEPPEHHLQPAPVGGRHRLGRDRGARACSTAPRPTWPTSPSSRPTSSSRPWASSSASWGRPACSLLLGICVVAAAAGRPAVP